MADQGTIDVIRDALADSGAVQMDRVELALDEGAIVLRGAVSTPEQATQAAMVAEQHADEVRNQLRVDPNLREDETDPATVARDAALRAGDDGLPREMEAQGRPAMGEWSAQTSQQVDVAQRTPGMEEPDDELTSDVTEALGENVAWDPPTQPHLAPTAEEQRGVLGHDAEPESTAEGGEPGAGPASLADMSQAELKRDARPRDDR